MRGKVKTELLFKDGDHREGYLTLDGVLVQLEVGTVIHMPADEDHLEIPEYLIMLRYKHPRSGNYSVVKDEGFRTYEEGRFLKHVGLKRGYVLERVQDQ